MGMVGIPRFLITGVGADIGRIRRIRIFVADLPRKTGSSPVYSRSASIVPSVARKNIRIQSSTAERPTPDGLLHGTPAFARVMSLGFGCTRTAAFHMRSLSRVPLALSRVPLALSRVPWESTEIFLMVKADLSLRGRSAGVPCRGLNFSRSGLVSESFFEKCLNNS